MSQQIDYQILLQEIIKTAHQAALQSSTVDSPFERGLKAAYYDILDVAKTQAEMMEVPLTEIGLDGVENDDYQSAASSC